jgi:peptide/nickel transport system permease protein
MEDALVSDTGRKRFDEFPDRRSMRSSPLRRHLGAVAGGVFLLTIVAFSWLGPLLYSVNPNAVDPAGALQHPHGGHILGTDQLGRDVLARLMHGGQTSLTVGLAAAAVATFLGVSYGVLAGFYGRWIDALLMRFVDVMMAIPVLFFVLLLAAIFRPTLVLLVLVVAIGAWLIPARLIRAETVSIMARQYIEAGRGLGASKFRLITKHVLPNAIGTIAVNLTFQVADAILLVAALSFLGFGIQPPTASWGGMLTDAQSYLFQNAWWLIYPPGGAILLTVVAVNLIGDGLRDALEVRRYYTR